MTRDIEAVGFDVDNTLYKLGPDIEMVLLENIVHSVSSVRGQAYNEARDDFFAHYNELHSASASLAKMGVPNGKALVQEAMENAGMASVLRKDAKLRRLMLSLSKRYKLFLITGSSLEHTHAKLRALGLSDPGLFKAQICSDSAYRREDGSAFRRVSEILSVPLQKMMFIGDREAIDILPAKSLGVKTAIVNGRSKEADYNLDAIYELEELLL